MGYLSNKFLKEKPAYYFIFQTIIAIVLIFFFLYFFQTSCMDVWQEGYDYCRAERELNTTGQISDVEFKITCWENCSIKNITSLPRGSLQIEPCIDCEGV